MTVPFYGKLVHALAMCPNGRFSKPSFIPLYWLVNRMAPIDWIVYIYIELILINPINYKVISSSINTSLNSA